MRTYLYLLFSVLFVITACKKELEPNQPPAVTVGNDTTFTLSNLNQYITLKGSAKDQDGSITGYMWSEIAGPNKANIVTSGSAITTANGLISGTYKFQMMATDNMGAVGVNAITITIIQNGVPPSENMLPVVNAGNDTTFNFTTSLSDTIRLKGSATDADGTITSYVCSQISGPNMSKIVNAGAANTAATGVISGNYTYQLVVTDNKGATASKTVVITVIKPNTTGTITIQPQQNPMDAHIAVVGSSDISDPSAPEFGATAWTSGGSPATTRGLVHFDLSGLPAGATVTAATLTLYSNPTPENGDKINANSGSNNSMLIQRVTTAWNSSVNWQTQPSTDASTQLVIPHTTQSRLDLNIDVTNMVKDMLQNGNNGFLIKLQTESYYNSRIFCSSKYSDSSKHPKLVLQYSK